jgi:ADP-ribosylglycohydrolase
MIKGAIGDFIGSIHEGYQWTHKNQDLLEVNIESIPVITKLFQAREKHSITDDTICSLGLLKAYFNDDLSHGAAQTLSTFCKSYRECGFGGQFEKWIDDPVPYESFANGCLMRLGFLEFVAPEQRLKYALMYTLISHDHNESIEAVIDYVKIYNDYSRLEEIAWQRDVKKSVEDYHQDRKFVISAKETLNQAIAVLRESSSFEEILKNCMYIGGDTDTLATIACELSQLEAPKYLQTIVKNEIVFGTNKTYGMILKELLLEDLTEDQNDPPLGRLF